LARPAHFNGSLPDILWASFSLLLALSGGLVLLVRRPAGFEFGLAQFALLSLGLGLHLLVPLPQGNYPGAVRLAQLAAFPLLLTLPFRFSFGPSPAGSPAIREGVQPEIFLPTLQLASAAGSQEFCRSRSMAVAHAPRRTCLLPPPDSRRSFQSSAVTTWKQGMVEAPPSTATGACPAEAFAR
jgi:hypothetical protein